MISKAAYTVMFYVLATVSLLLALHVVSASRLLRAALALMFVLVVSAGFYLLLGYEFLAGVQVLVYVGGIVVLIVFAVMLTSTTDLKEDLPLAHRKFFGALAAFGFFGLTTVALVWSKFPFISKGGGRPAFNDAAEIGRKLLSDGSQGYVLPFEIISLVLLAAIIGGIVIGRKVPPPNQPFVTGNDPEAAMSAALPNKQLREEDLPIQKGGAS